MIRFECDYGEGALPKILERMRETNLEQSVGYGEDEHCEKARAYVRALCKTEKASVHFLVGGTQANMTVIAAALKPYQAVVSAATGHINVHETGAVEAAGHKILALPSEDGKITAAQVERVFAEHYADSTHEHMAQPGMVYLSQPTENGTLYTKKELNQISKICKKAGAYLFVDGARLIYGLAAPGNDVQIADLARLTDVFYIGGTKAGALFGEAVVIMNSEINRDFRYMIKQRGGMLAKGRLLGLQYECLLEDDTYKKVGEHAISLAMALRSAFIDKGWPLLYGSMTNQQFPVIQNDELRALESKYSFSRWAEMDSGHTAVRFCTSWATKEENVRALIADIMAL